MNLDLQSVDPQPQFNILIIDFQLTTLSSCTPTAIDISAVIPSLITDV